ncbi:cytochrome P450 [Pisolithus marmoratus]|nr:cytochrome P450 [Pisolithus marmoratus]
MVEIPPGLVHIGHQLPRLVLPLVFAYASSRTWAIVFEEPAPSLADDFRVVLYTHIRDRREAARRGAILAPRVKSRWPGGFDILLSIAREFRKGDIGSPFDQYCQEYGPIVNIRTMFEDRILTTEPEHIKAILSTQFDSFEKGGFRPMPSFLGPTKRSAWNWSVQLRRFHRTMARPFFSKDRISHFDIFEKHAEDALNQAKARLQEGYPVDFQDMVYRFTLDSATEFLFGKSVRSLSAGLVYSKNSQPGKHRDFTNHSANAFARALAEAQSQAMLRTNFGSSWRLAEFWGDRIRKEMEVCYRFIDPILKDALETKRMMKDGDQYTGQRSTTDLTVIRDEIVNILIAGRDTTASALTSLIYMLSQHPDILKRLRAEVLSKVGSSRRPTYDDVREMKYMRAVINETLRLYPPVPFNFRTNTEAVIWSGVNGGPPIYIPPKTQIPFSVLLMQRRKDLWGPDADIFDPDRFLDERLKYLTSNPFIFLPFSAGPRICIGQQFAYNEMSFFLVRLLQTFSSITLAVNVQTRRGESAQGTGRNSQDKVTFRRHVVLYVDEGLWMMGEADDTNSVMLDTSQEYADN